MDAITPSPELRLICQILEHIDLPDNVQHQHIVNGTPYDITITRLGLNPAMALQVYRQFGVKGVQHSAATMFFWNTSGAPAHICDDFKAQTGDAIFEIIYDAMATSP